MAYNKILIPELNFFNGMSNCPGLYEIAVQVDMPLKSINRG